MDIPEMRRIAEAATPGPWMRYDVSGDHYGVRRKPELAVCRSYGESIAANADMEYIATFNPAAVLQLIERVERYEDALECIGSYASDPENADQLAFEAVRSMTNIARDALEQDHD